MEEENFDKLSVEERCTHKSWKARISGYTSLVSVFDNISDEKSDEWNKYVLIVKNILLENNDPALEKGLQVVLNFSLKAAVAAKIVGHVVAGLVKKCVASPRARIRDLALQICLAYIECEKQKLVADELLKGTESKNPKISVGCVRILTEVIRAFGTTVIPVEGIFQKLPILLEDRDQNVRNEVKSLTIEIYRWLGSDLGNNLLKPEILKPQKLAEIVSEIAKIKDRSTVPLRFLRSQQKVQEVAGSEVDDLVCYGTADDQTVELEVNELKPVEIIPLIPAEFQNRVKSPKWIERKEAIENLEKILLDVGRIQNGDFHDIINALVNTISKDANITVVCLAVKCVTNFAQKLEGGFSQHSLVVFRALLEKLKEKKPSVVQTLREALGAVFKSSTFDVFVNDLSECLRNKNPNVKSECALFLSQCFSRLSPTSLSKKSLKPLFPALVTCLSDQDPSVRDQSAKALGVAMGILGENGLSPLFIDLESTKLLKIKECAKSFLEQTKNLNSSPPFYAAKLKNECTYPKSDSKYCSEKPTEQLSEKNIVGASKIVTKTESTLPRSSNKSKESIADSISEETITALSGKDWFVRLQAISEIQTIVNSASDISTTELGELGPLLNARILDSNPKISAASINLVASLAGKIGPPFRDQLRSLLPALLKAVGDIKGGVRDAAVNSLTKIGENCGYGEIFKSEFLPESLKSGSITAKGKLWRWVAENLPKTTMKDVSKIDLENILPSLFASLEEKSAEVRAEASNAVDGFLKVLTLGKMISFCDKFYGNSNNSVIKVILDKHSSGLLPEVPESPSKRPEKAKLKSLKSPSPMLSRKKVTFVDDGENPPLLDVNNLKNQRVIDEHKHKTAKWDFVSPRGEFVELLKGLMSAANFSQELTKLMFHPDFRCHIKAMDLLTEEISQNSVGIVCNLDLILRWLTLRFFDGNPTVLSKSLDFFITALAHLKETNYCLLDSEAVAFVPYLVMKLGDSKENIQTKVKEILVNLTSLYPVSKLKKFVLDGARSNIARQRKNCLDVVASYINVYGDSVYLSEIDSVSEAVGKLLKDRDPGVKKKAFLVAGILHDREGEKIMKFIEKHAGEGFHAIEDKIRRYIVSRPTAAQNQLKIPDAGSCHSEEVVCSEFEIASAECPPQIPENLPELESRNEVSDETSQQKQPRAFHWNADLVQEIDDLAKLVIQPADIVDVDLEFMKDDPKSLKSLNRAFQLPASTKLLYSSNIPSILSYLECISDADLITSKNGMKYIDMILKSGGGEELDNYTDLLIQKLAQNLEKLGRRDYNEILENYSSTFTLLIALCNEKRFIEQFSEERLYDTLEQLLLIISNYKFSGKENEIYRKTVNTIILKILENSRKTPLMCGLLRMLGKTREAGSTVFSGKMNELCMKCLWKLNRAQATWDRELDYGVIFSVIRKLLRGFPAPWWKSMPGDMSLRTVKTVLRTMVKLRGKRVLNDVGLDDECELRRYLSKLVKHLSHVNTAKPRPFGMVTTAQNLMPSQAKELSDIFSDIALSSPGAIQKLNEFKRRNPLVDLHRILSTMSPAFLKYFLVIAGETDEIDGGSLRDGTADANPKGDGNFPEEVRRMWGKLKSLQERIDTVKDT